MKITKFPAIAVVLCLILIGTILPACTNEQGPLDYVAVASKVWQSGQTESVSLALFRDNKPANGEIKLALFKEGEAVLGAHGVINGKGSIEIKLPTLSEGDYELQVDGPGFQETATVRVEQNLLLFMETDKPIYKPSQTIRIRTVTLDRELKPEPETVTVEVMDAKGIKIFRKDVLTDEYGMGILDLPLSKEPNLGVWKVVATSGDQSTQLDVRVEEYVLPKYEVSVQLPKEWFLVNEPIEGKITAEYSFGKPVKGELEIKALRYVGEWEEYTLLTKKISGEAAFDLPPVNYVAGTPAAGGMGNVMLEVVVREEATGYEEKVTKLLTVASSSTNVQIIPEGPVFKPSLPFSFLIITETPDNQPIDAQVDVNITYLDSEFQQAGQETAQVNTVNGKSLLTATPPEESAALIIEARSQNSEAYKALQAGYSPSGNFIHVEQISDGIPTVGEEVSFRIHSTSEASNFYYEVISRGKVVFTNYTRDNVVSFTTTPLMAPNSRLLVYQILPNSEVAADYLPFSVEANYPHDASVAFSEDEVKPGDELAIDIDAEGQSKVSLAVVDKSVFILAENRLNLQQVFDELKRLYMEPQVELHSASLYTKIETKGSEEIFTDAGVVVLSNATIPQGKEYERQGMVFEERDGGKGIALEGMPVPAPAATASPASNDTGSLAEVQRVRQFFPETWLWEEVTTDPQGKGVLNVTAPDTITTWVLRAVSISKENGLGVSEDELVVFQPFFISIDLPYSAIRGEEFPVSIAIYNYLDEEQSVFLEIEEADWFDLLDETTKTVDVAANGIGSVRFMISPTELGVNEVKITARSTEAADAVIKTIIVEPEGVEREVVENFVLGAGNSQTVSTAVPYDVVAGSPRAYIAVTSSYLTQTIEGLDSLLQMPFGCGEQNMIMLAPDVYIAKYLEESNQLKPEIMAKAEMLMITGYQRQLTFRRSDGSFSAFGESDKEGSLWLTAFVLKTFAGAKDLIYIDETILQEARQWITSHQNTDGSFDPIGFVHHQEMIGGVSGKNALTAYVAIALLEAGETTSSARAVSYLEGELAGIEDPYTLALISYALEMSDSALRDEAYQMLLELAQADEEGLHWGTTAIQEIRETPRGLPQAGQTSAIEATAYATLALLKHGDMINSGLAAKWLVSRRNAYGGFGSTQDTVVALQALTSQATEGRADVDLSVTITADGRDTELIINQDNFDLLQIVEVSPDAEVEIKATGKGDVVVQAITRFNLPVSSPEGQIFDIQVGYDTTQVEVNDLVKVSVALKFNPSLPIEAGMVVLDVAVPTGFAPVIESIEKVAASEAKIKRYDVAGRKVIFYLENLLPEEEISFAFEVQAKYPVKAKSVTSQAYSYYKPGLRGEWQSQPIIVLD
ncbi:alpha-2-macroglobulin family protein [Chloroflexota bacterium]